MLRIATFVLLCLALQSCAPTILYLGDSYQPVASVEVYYDAKEIKKEYRVMGRMTNGEVIAYGAERVKMQMIEKAKQVGADGIIFSSISVGEGDKHSQGEVKAELIKFL